MHNVTLCHFDVDDDVVKILTLTTYNGNWKTGTPLVDSFEARFGKLGAFTGTDVGHSLPPDSFLGSVHRGSLIK